MYSHTAPDIYLIDGDLPIAQQAWHSARARHPAPTVFLKADVAPSSGGTREFRRPLVPSCLLSLVNLLDEVTVEDLHFLPELSIGQEGAAPDTSLEVKSSRGTRFSALVVDDSSTVRAQVGLGLKMFGVNADFAETAEEALELLARNVYDIAFLDVVLPGADGYQICKAIKKGKLTNTTVVMLTSKSSAFDRVKASLAGCDAFLTKPVENSMFQQVLRKYLLEQDVSEGTRQTLTAR
jgi:twitching motility two-component system response regulator PilG